MEKVDYEVLVIGGGPGGLNAALYASRMGLKTGIVEGGLPGGQLNNTGEVENYLGYTLITGEDLADEMNSHMEAFIPEEDRHFGYVTNVLKDEGVHKVYIDDKVLTSKTVILATGSEHKKLGVPGEEEYSGMGVSYCAICDGMFFKNKKIMVVGGGNSAVEEALYLSKLGSEVVIVHRRDELRADKFYADKAFANEKISFIWDTTVEEIKGDGSKVTGVVLKNVKTGKITETDTSSVFIYVGVVPVKPEIEVGLDGNDITSEGFITTKEDMSTSAPGFFVIGDLRNKDLKQIITAASDGAVAAQSAYSYVQKN